MSLPSILAWGPLMPIQRPSPVVAAAAAVAVDVGALALDAVCFQTLPIDVHLLHTGGLQCPLVSLPGLPEGFVMLGSSPSGLRVGSHLVAGQQSCHSGPPLALLQHRSALSSL